MKKILMITMILMLAVGFTACASGAPESSQSESTQESSEVSAKIWDESELETILDDVVANTELSSDDYKGMITDGTQTAEITEDMEEYHMGSTDYTFTRAIIREPMMSSQAFSLMLIATETEEEAKALSEEIGGTVDPKKWVCVWVEDEDVKVTTSGNLVLVVMAEESESFIAGFESVVNEA